MKCIWEEEGMCIVYLSFVFLAAFGGGTVDSAVLD